MRKILLFIVFSLLMASGMLSRAQSANLQDDVAAQDSTLDVIGWFSKNDTLEYWIVQSDWRISAADTVKTAGVSTKVRIVVTDSTATGYKMDYTFLDFRGDSIENSPVGDFQNKIVEKLGRKIVGTTIHFETDEFGAITKFNNLGKVEKQAKSLFKEAMKEFVALPEIQELKEMGLDIKDLIKTNVDTDKLVEGYLEELKMLFVCHGRTYDIGERNVHEDATETQYENDTYSSVSVDREEGTYQIVFDVVNVIPQSDIKDLIGSVVELFSDESLNENFKNEIDSQVKVDGSLSSYLSLDFISDGWPYKVVKQNVTMIDDRGKASQTYIYLDYLSVHNQ